ncbi:hypothetical protein AAFF_G00236200 [Aldrovandia affinis]|uniref:L1 transposable element RRM domain-containing protein n=1 Tax=Aldrovandia affinis TaxID=143900 RepID=A0AAD7W4A7_9TELE|nr:hypothetical protein AAFF_G00236200 [Aldrovandia affinis]
MLADESGESETTDIEQTLCEDEAGTDISNRMLFDMLRKISTEMEDLKTIKQTTASVEAKLSSLLTRVTEVEERVSELEDTLMQHKGNPPPTKADMEDILERLAMAEDRSRRNNLRFVGFAEGVEGRDIIVFLNKFFASAFDTDVPVGGFEIERAHRIRARRPAPSDRPRTIIAAFLRHQDRQRILQAARGTRRIEWEGKQVMIFPDFSRETQDKRASFRQCKKALHERKIKFSLLYPALLSIKVGEGAPRVFDNPQSAMDFIQKR